MYYQDTAIVLKRVDLRDDDLLVTFFTFKHGKIVAQAKGAKKIKSKLAGHLEPVNLVEINWVAGKGGDKLIGAQVIKSFKEIKKSYTKNIYSFYFLEIVDKVTRPYHCDIKIFDFLKSVLNKLENLEEDQFPLVKLCFNYKILFLLGYNPVNRKGLGNNLKTVISHIINSPVEGIIGKKIEKNVFDSLSIKAEKFLEEVIEEEVVSQAVLFKYILQES